ncbi:OmpH family outer membrane protein [Deinococcus koreensis]|uniref:Outer membrane chaperone OmpH n=1 Tax=Deinococcus koreensis TaxID=2054903 RepID=A0A2K3V056_9DEIO|nr:OmpH family outer membrane protein [Deinococcus koreensis]PNY82178.1 outer membrane chaperone OmpH [Deinococcus koreensis]
MNKVLMLLPLALLATVPHAQQSKSRVAMVNVQTLIKAMPGNASYLALMTKVDKDLKSRQASLQTLAAKAATTRSTADQQALTKAQQAYTAQRADYDKQIQTAFKPLGTRLNTVVAQVARANGISVVMDDTVAAQTGLVVYADPTANLTNAVLKALK